VAGSYSSLTPWCQQTLWLGRKWLCFCSADHHLLHHSPAMLAACWLSSVVVVIFDGCHHHHHHDDFRWIFSPFLWTVPTLLLLSLLFFNGWLAAHCWLDPGWHLPISTAGWLLDCCLCCWVSSWYGQAVREQLLENSSFQFDVLSSASLLCLFCCVVLLLVVVACCWLLLIFSYSRFWWLFLFIIKLIIIIYELLLFYCILFIIAVAIARQCVLDAWWC